VPCDAITTQSVNLANADPGILADGLTADGWTVTSVQADTLVARKTMDYYDTRLTWRKGKGLELDGQPNRQDRTFSEIAKAYSVQAVSWAAQRAGWQVTRTGQDTLSVTRR